MPIMDGLTAVRTILSKLGAAAPPIVVLTASASDEERQRCDAAGASGFLTKPVKVGQMGLLQDFVLQAQHRRSPGQTPPRGNSDVSEAAR
jgi:CheY-like chemotaxis protein